MIYASQLKDKEFNELYSMVEKQVSEAADQQYQATGRAGHYPSPWSVLFEDWLRDKVDTQTVRDSLNAGKVI